ncbi:MAG: hypothetical protein NTX42_03555 [Methanothrix sp.]|nr:hypothetical protein [Methanothrix sp.]
MRARVPMREPARALARKTAKRPGPFGSERGPEPDNGSNHGQRAAGRGWPTARKDRNAGGPPRISLRVLCAFVPLWLAVAARL